jgi:carbon-monoxide dehydrogenase medium subunit
MTSGYAGGEKLLPEICYHRVTVIDRALALLAEHGPDAAILAGGTDLIIGLQDGTTCARHLIDIKAIPGFNEISVSDSGDLVIGACVTINGLLEAGVPRGMEALTQAAGMLATNQLRNRATVAGNVCNASPACDLGPPLLVLGGLVRVVSPSGERSIPLKDFFSGVKCTCCGPDEIVTHVLVPAAGEAAVSAFRKRQRLKGHDLAVVNAAASYSKSAVLKVALGAVAETPVLIGGLDGAGPEDRIKVLENVMNSISPISDLRGSREYRLKMVEFLVGELLDELSEKIKQGGL